MTPAMASVPYCAAAPSCSTSTRSMAATGMKFRSAAAPPWNAPASTARLAVPWRRLPLTSTSVLFGDSPRRRADSVMAAMSLPKAWALSDGRFWASAWIRSGWPVRASDDASSTWIGEALSATVRPAARVPVTITTPALAIAGASGATAAAGVSTAGSGALSAAWAATPHDSKAAATLV